jgi:putative ABC transport system permease protein
VTDLHKHLGTSVGDRVYALLLLAFPRRFRARYAEAMRQIFCERYARAREDGPSAAVGFLARSAVDVLANAGLERAAAVRQWFLFPNFHEQLAQREQETRPMSWQALTMDLRYALRMFVRTPVFTGMTVLALALGIGANSAIFSVVNAVLLKPLPYADPDRLVMVWNDNTREGIAQYPMSPANFLDVKAATRTLDRMEMMYSFLATPILRTNDGTEQMSASGTTPGMFEMLGRSAALGRTLQPADRAQVIVLSDGYWRRRFGADPGIVGRKLIVEDQPTTVIGVMPPDFHFPLKSMLGPSGFSPSVEPDVWMPIDMNDSRFMQNGVPVRLPHYLSVVGRLAPGATAEQAREELIGITARLAQEYPDINRGLSATVLSLHDQAVGRVRPALVLLLAGVGFVLLMACVNVANLLLARSVARQKEIAVRTALGAGRARLLAQMLAESVLLSAVGGLLGLAFVWAGVRLLVSIAPPELPRLNEIQPDLTVVLFTAAVSLAAGVLVGTAPAIAAGRGDVQGALKDASRGVAGGVLRQRLRASLVVGEVALAVVLTVGAGLLLRSFVTLLSVDPGFRSENLLTLQVQVPRRLAAADARNAFYTELFQRLDSLPGVVASGGTTRLPLGSTNVSTRVLIDGRAMTPGEMPEVEMRRAVHDYFRAMGMPILRGRGFTAEDGPTTAPVAVINQTMARRLWPNEDPVGRRFKMGTNPQTPWSTVIGVVGDLRHAGLDVEPAAEFYIWYRQGPPVAPFIVVRTQGDPAALAESVRSELRALEKEMAVYDMRSMTEVRAASVAERRFILILAIAFGALALTLAAVGVYGVMALVVSERTQEIGIRLALGAEPLRVLGLVVRQAITLAAIGVAVGFVAAMALTPFMAGQLYGIDATDPATLAGVPALLLLVALVACMVPAIRAMRVDPVTALRYE